MENEQEHEMLSMLMSRESAVSTNVENCVHAQETLNGSSQKGEKSDSINPSSTGDTKQTPARVL